MYSLKKVRNIFIAVLCCIILVQLEKGHIANAATKKVIKVTSSTSYENCKEKMTVKGLDKNGKTVWEYKTKSYNMTELEQTLCVSHKNRVYIFESGKVIALKKQSGEKIWTVKDVSPAGFVYHFDNKNNIYLIGYYDTNLYKISSSGDVLWKCDFSKTGNYCPIKIQIKNKIITIHFEANESDPSGSNTHYVNVNKDGEIKKFQ